MVEGLSQTHCQGHGGIAFNHQVRQNILHQRLLHQRPAKRPAMHTVVNRLHHRLAQGGGRGDGAIKSRQGHHLDDGRHAPPFLTQQPTLGPAQLHLTGGIGDIAGLVFQPLQ